MKVLLGRHAVLAGLGVLLVSAPARAQTCNGSPTSTRLLVEVVGVKSDRGFVVGNLFPNDKHRFLEDNGWLTVWREPAKPGAVMLCTWLPGPGYYAVVVFHDANANGVLDQGPFGIPEEGYGFSNNVRPFLRAPSLNASRFLAKEGDTMLRIRLRYP